MAAQQDFSRLVQPHFEALYRAAFRLTRRREDAEDLVQEVCIRAYAELKTLEQLDHVLGWLLRVQYRVFIDVLRRLRRSPVIGFDPTTANEEHVASGLPGPEHLADIASEYTRVSLAWARLSREQRALLALHAEGYALAELEEITGKNRNVLSARLHRARKSLARFLNSSAPVTDAFPATVSKNGL